MVDKTLGPYILLDVVGRGGMGTVYRARNQDTGEVCAVKALSPTFAEDDHFRNRFESEIKALMKLDHPNIVRLISYGQEKGNLYFAMELVVGKSLFHLQREGHHFDWREVLRIAKDIASGLRHAHDRGIIHRDLKPGNLLQADTGINKITDFGIAKSFGTSQNTGTNILGTMDFMSPEQAKGEPVTVRSDLYSLGTVMFTLLSGRPPFSSNSVEESIRNLTRVPAPPVSTVVPDVPKELDVLIRRLMHKMPEKRVPTAQALLHRIDEVEQTLRHYSEAQTAKHTNTGDTFDICLPEKGSSSKTERIEAKTEPNTIPGGMIDQGTTIETSHESHAEAKPGKQKADFFSPVDTRKKREDAHPVVDPVFKSKGFWVLTAGLSAVIVLTVIGLVIASRPPDADKLFAAIERSRDTPEKVREQIGLFLNHHSDDIRVEEVKRLDGLADAIALHNLLSIRANVSGMKQRLSEIEKQYLNIVKSVDENPAQSHSLLKSFVIMHGDNEEADENDQKCIRAAQSYITKIARDAQTKMEFHRDRIEKRMKEALELSTEKQIEIYSSIVELYDGIDWARDLVLEAKKELQERQ